MKSQFIQVWTALVAPPPEPVLEPPGPVLIPVRRPRRSVGVRFAVQGRLDRRTVAGLDAGWLGSELALDLSQVTYIDAHGLSELLALDSRLRQRAGRLVLLAPSECVTQALRLFGMHPGGPLALKIR